MSTRPRTIPLIIPIAVILIVVSLLLVGLSYLYSRPVSIFPDGTGNRIIRIKTSVTYENKIAGTELWNFSTDDKTLGLFMNTSWQTVYLSEVTYPIERFYEDDGNPVALLSFPKASIDNGENLSYGATYRAILKPRSVPEISEEKSETSSEIPDYLKTAYCRPSGPWQVDDPQLRETAFEIKGNETKVLPLMEKIIVWISKNIEYGIADTARYPNETYAERTGDCDDQANLLITFCRIVGIPAYLQVGCIYLPQYHENDTSWDGHLMNTQTRIGWHGWAIVYIPPWGWLPVDLTYVSGDLSKEPLNAIRTSAIITEPTVQYANVTESDYVADSRNLREFLVTHQFFIYEEDVMNEETSESIANYVVIIHRNMNSKEFENVLSAVTCITPVLLKISRHERDAFRDVFLNHRTI